MPQECILSCYLYYMFFILMFQAVLIYIMLTCNLASYGIAAISPFSHRLAFDNMSMDIQRLRCKVNFQALTFVPHIKALGDALVNRLRYPPSSGYLEEPTNVKHKAGKFVVLHLRFDKVYFSFLLYYITCFYMHTVARIRVTNLFKITQKEKLSKFKFSCLTSFM